jgi:hypothetical protein
MPEPAPGSWRWWLLVAEAMALLAIARCLIALFRLNLWRGLLGETLDEAGATPPPSALARLLAAAIERGAARLPFTCKCLPRALALHWMLRRRGLPSQLVITVLDPAHRSEGENLHAWVETGGAILIGAIDRPYVPLARFGSRNP